MNTEIRRYLDILRIELTDIESALLEKEEKIGQRFKSNELTYYVTEENLALIRQEIAGVRQIIETLGAMDFSDVSSVDQLTERLERIVTEKSAEYDLPDAVLVYIKRKLRQVKDFVSVD